MTTTLTPATKSLVTRARKLIATLAAGEWEGMNGATDLMVRVNALANKVCRAGAPEIADELYAAKSAAVRSGEAARAERSALALREARAAAREESRERSWMLR